MLATITILGMARWMSAGSQSRLVGEFVPILLLVATAGLLGAAWHDLNSLAHNQLNHDRTRCLPKPLTPGGVPFWKRLLDCTLVITSAPLWLPLGAVLALWVKIISPGPVLFGQERVGHLGGRFRCLKFRTMKVNADTTVHREHIHHLMKSNRPMRKLDNTGDPRLIPGGLWLRTLGVDELPQLLNVLRGEMSLVGPRPTTSYEYEMLQLHHRRRCQTLPGLTGLWQVKGKNRTTFARMMELDLHYVENKSLFLDIEIIARTVPAILVQVWDVKIGSKFAAKTAPGDNAQADLQGGNPLSSIETNPCESSPVPVLAGSHGNEAPSGSVCK